MPAPTAATLTIDPAGNNNSMDYTAKTKGTLAQGISIEYKDGGTAGSETISGTGLTITVNMQANTSTAAQIKTAIDGDSRASGLVSVANHAGNDGSGACPAVAATFMTGGVNGGPDGDVPLATRANRVYAAEAILSGYVDGDLSTVITAARAQGYKDDASIPSVRHGGILGGNNA